MATIVFKDGQILFEGGAVAMGTACCCEELPLCGTGTTIVRDSITVTFSGVDAAICGGCIQSGAFDSVRPQSISLDGSYVVPKFITGIYHGTFSVSNSITFQFHNNNQDCSNTPVAETHSDEISITVELVCPSGTVTSPRITRIFAESGLVPPEVPGYPLFSYANLSSTHSPGDAIANQLTCGTVISSSGFSGGGMAVAE